MKTLAVFELTQRHNGEYRKEVWRKILRKYRLSGSNLLTDVCLLDENAITMKMNLPTDEFLCRQQSFSVFQQCRYSWRHGAVTFVVWIVIHLWSSEKPDTPDHILVLQLSNDVFSEKHLVFYFYLQQKQKLKPLFSSEQIIFIESNPSKLRWRYMNWLGANLNGGWTANRINFSCGLMP